MTTDPYTQVLRSLSWPGVARRGLAAQGRARHGMGPGAGNRPGSAQVGVS